MDEIIDLCRELKCSFAYTCEWWYTDNPTLKHEWSIASSKKGESNSSVHAHLDDCLIACMAWLKQIQNQRTHHEIRLLEGNDLDSMRTDLGTEL